MIKTVLLLLILYFHTEIKFCDYDLAGILSVKDDDST